MVTNKHTTIWIGTLIVLLAAILRLSAFEEALVGADQSSILAAAAEIAAFRDFPEVGIKSSVGVMQTAITAYLAAIPLLVVHKVIAIKWFFSILDLLAIALLFNAVKRSFGLRAASVAALLYATNPWIVEFNRWIWYQTLIPTFATTAFAAFLLLLRQDKPHARGLLSIGLVSATLMGMVHLAAVPWAAMLLLLGLVIAWHHKEWRGFVWGSALSVVIVLPYARYLFKTGFADVRLILQGSGENGNGWNWAAYLLSRELLTGDQVFKTPRDPLWAGSVLQLPVLYTVIPVVLALAIVGILPYLWRKSGWQRPSGFALAWTLLAPTLLVPTHFHLQHFYLLFLFPAPYVLTGAWLEACLSRAYDRAAKIWDYAGRVALAALLCLALWWTYVWIVRIHFESRGELRAPTRAWLMDLTVERIADYLETEPESAIILLTTFDGGDLSPFDWIRNFVHNDRVRVIPTGQGLIIPPDPTCYLLAAGASEADLRPVAATLVENPALAIPATPPWRGYCTPWRGPLSEAMAQWENGMSLRHADVSGALAPGAQLDITYTWHYRAIAAKEYHIFNHLLLGETLIAQVDGMGVPTWYWRDDDVLVTHFVLQLPATLETGDYRLLTGTYTWPEVQRVFLVDGAPAYEVACWESP